MGILNQIYEEAFLGFSYGFRPNRHQHRALDAVWVWITQRKINWVLDADIRGFFDTIDHEWLMRFLEHRIADSTHELSEKESYCDRVEILKSVPGVGTIAAMELLLELQNVARFRHADQLTAYVGLAPSQYSSADKVRMGRITKVGKHSLRAVLVQAAWQLIRKGWAMREKYDRIKTRLGARRAIVAVARTLLLLVRRLWLDLVPCRLASCA